MPNPLRRKFVYIVEQGTSNELLVANGSSCINYSKLFVFFIRVRVTDDASV
jgi:hypothetical protein